MARRVRSAEHLSRLSGNLPILESLSREDGRIKKKAEREIDRPLTTGLYLLRCKEFNLSIEDLKEIDYGMILDMLIEKSNDSYEYDYLANEDDYKNF